MDGYPAHYIAHNIPLILLSGLGTPDPGGVDEIEERYELLQRNGIRISSDLSDVTGQTAEALLDCFRYFDAQDAAWNNRPGPGKLGSMGFTYRCVGRSITLPPHKDRLLDSVVNSTESDGSKSLSHTLHSPLSPLSPESPLYADGVMSPLWFTKHQLLLPAALAVFYPFTVDPNRTTLEDNRLKNEINAFKSDVVASGYKTRLIVVLVSESDAADPSAAERVANLRRATALDAKTLFYLPGYTGPVEIRAFVGSLLSTIQPACIEYYRDLSKHARRKRNRGSTPQPAPTPPSGGQILSSPGWTIRYETKLGAFAEFRQEMDAAGRSYEVAYETLLDSDLFESLDFRSSRFREARLLADVLAMRIVRCLLWTGQTTSAVQSWLNHSSRIHDLIEEKSEAGSSYGWYAWDARWAKLMAELVEKVEVPLFHVQQGVRSPGSITPEFPMTFAPPEKNMAIESRLTPWESLHHQGYWLDRSAAATRTRRSLAHTIPPEDKEPPSLQTQPPEDDTPSRYDVFMCPDPSQEPQFDHSSLLISTLEAADREYVAREQPRASERTRLSIGIEHIQSERWQEATDILRPLWQTLSWRQAQWWDLVAEASSAIKTCAAKIGDWEMYLAAQWELLSQSLPRPMGPGLDFNRCLDSFELPQKPHISLNADNVAPTFSARFCFSSARGNAGVPEAAQLTISSLTHPNVAPITLSSISVALDGSLKNFALTHDPDIRPVATHSDGTCAFDIDAADVSGSNQSVNLEFSTGQRKVFNFKLIPREAGEVRASSVTLQIKRDAFDFDIAVPLREAAIPPVWWAMAGDSLIRKSLAIDRACSLTVHPKPPKLKIELLQFHQTYYIDEAVGVNVHFENAEDDTADVRLTTSLSSTAQSVPALHVGPLPSALDIPLVEESTSRIEDQGVGLLAPGTTADQIVSFRAVPGFAELYLVVRADYYLVSDPETPVTVILKEKLFFTSPLEVSCSFLPRLDPEPWPSYFVINDDPALEEKGLRQKWTVSADFSSFALDQLVIESVVLEVVHAKYGATCEIAPSAETGTETAIAPNETLARSFNLEIKKLSLDDRRSALVSFQLNVAWHREDEANRTANTVLLVPSLTVPFGEPRVLCSAMPSKQRSRMINLTYVLENPSTHLLSFSVTMETSDEFAFSGPKAKLLQLVPLSRTEIRYNIVSFDEGVWVHPYLRVTDTGFGQELKVLAAEGCRNEKKTIAVWIGVQDGE